MGDEISGGKRSEITMAGPPFGNQIGKENYLDVLKLVSV
jgi:hypothetical protein